MEVFKRRIHCFIVCKWMWKFIRDVYTVSCFVTGYGNLQETYTLFHTMQLDLEVCKRGVHRFIFCKRMWKFIKDIYTVSYFVSGCGSL